MTKPEPKPCSLFLKPVLIIRCSPCVSRLVLIPFPGAWGPTCWNSDCSVGLLTARLPFCPNLHIKSLLPGSLLQWSALSLHPSPGSVHQHLSSGWLRSAQSTWQRQPEPSLQNANFIVPLTCLSQSGASHKDEVWNSYQDLPGSSQMYMSGLLNFLLFLLQSLPLCHLFVPHTHPPPKPVFYSYLRS